jgi:hypothetical protein
MFNLPSGVQNLRKKLPALLAFSLLFWGGGGPLQAAELAGGTLTVVRDAEAADCPDDAALANATLSLGTPPAERAEGIAVRVVFQRDAFGYGALVTTTGSQAGVREIRKPGPTCAPAAEAVSVVLAVLFDLAPLEEGGVAAPPPAPAPSPAPPKPRLDARPAPRPSPPAPRPAAPPDAGPALRVGIGAQAGLSYGLLGAAPVVAVSGALRASIGRWELGAGALGAPNRAVDYLGRAVYVSVVAGRLAGCGWLFPSRDRPDVALCAGALLGRLRARGDGFDRDAPVAADLWLAYEAGAVGRLPLTQNIALRLGISVLVPSRSQSYEVAGAGTAFESSPAAGLLELGPELRFP